MDQIVVVDQFTPVYLFMPTPKFIQNQHNYTIHDQFDDYLLCGKHLLHEKVQIFERIEGGRE